MSNPLAPSALAIPGPQMGLNHIIDAFTQQISEERSKEMKYNPLRPSSAGKCARELAYEYAQFKGYAEVDQKPFPPAVSRLLDLGYSIEYHGNNQMKQAFAKMPKPIQIKYKQQTVDICMLPDGTRIEGSLDIWLDGGDWRAIADWKSKAEKWSSFYKSSWEEFQESLLKTGFAVSIGTEYGTDAVFITDLGAFLKAHNDPWFAKNLYQINLYGCSKFAKDHNITFCSVMQYGKSTSQLREVRWVPDQAVADNRIEMFQIVAKVVDETKDPTKVQKDYLLGSAKCGFCDFRAKCWPDKDAMKESFKNLPYKTWPKDIDRIRSTTTQAGLLDLFALYEGAGAAVEESEKAEQEIIKALDKEGIKKIRLDEHRIYEVKQLKSGGPNGGGRLVLRRSKV